MTFFTARTLSVGQSEILMIKDTCTPILAIFQKENCPFIFLNVETSPSRNVSTFLDFGHFFFNVERSLYRDVSTFLDFAHFFNMWSHQSIPQCPIEYQDLLMVFPSLEEFGGKMSWFL